MPVERYLGVPLHRPKVAFFEFTACEGCQLQILKWGMHIMTPDT